MVKQLDWRYWKATEIVEDFTSPYTGKTYKAGTPIATTSGIRHGDREIRIGDPSAPALFLNQAHKSHQEAMKIHPFILEKWPPDIDEEPTVMAYDYLEYTMSSVIYSHTAIESFANETIPEKIQYKEERNSGLAVVRDKEWVERNKSLTDKLGDILPRELEIESPRGLQVWEGYVELRRFRDRIIHMKSSDRETAKNEILFPESIWSDLTNPEIPDFPLIAKSIISYFLRNNEPHWITNCPF